MLELYSIHLIAEFLQVCLPNVKNNQQYIYCFINWNRTNFFCECFTFFTINLVLYSVPKYVEATVKSITVNRSFLSYFASMHSFVTLKSDSLPCHFPPLTHLPLFSCILVFLFLRSVLQSPLESSCHPHSFFPSTFQLFFLSLGCSVLPVLLTDSHVPMASACCSTACVCDQLSPASQLFISSS